MRKIKGIVEKYGYNAVDLSIYYSSVKVSGKQEFGVVLLKNIEVTIAVLTAMKEYSSTIPVSIKTRVGVEDHDDLHFITEFIHILSIVRA